MCTECKKGMPSPFLSMDMRLLWCSCKVPGLYPEQINLGTALKVMFSTQEYEKQKDFAGTEECTIAIT